MKDAQRKATPPQVITASEAEARAASAAQYLVTHLRASNEQFLRDNPEEAEVPLLVPLDERAFQRFRSIMYSAIATKYVIVPD
jgi:hypothetical protein